MKTYPPTAEFRFILARARFIDTKKGVFPGVFESLGPAA